MIHLSRRTGLLPRIPDRLTWSDALRLGLHGKVIQQVSKSINASQVSLHQPSVLFLSFRTRTGRVELASTMKSNRRSELEKKKQPLQRRQCYHHCDTRAFRFFLLSSTLLQKSPLKKEPVTPTFYCCPVILTGVFVPKYRRLNRFSPSKHPGESSGAD